MKVLILGSSGLLGNTLKIFLKEKKIKLYFISKKKSTKRNFNLRSFKNFEKLEKVIKKINPEYIINCIGVTHHHKTYEDKNNTKTINSVLPLYLSKLCLKYKIHFVHISTDCVFSGKSGNYSEKSRKNPISYYGLTKSKGEVKNEYSTTIRTSFIGPEVKTKNQLINWFLCQKNEVKGFDKAFFSGLTSLELSHIIYTYFLKKHFLYNLILNIGGPKISKYKLLLLISKVFKKKIFINKFSKLKIDRSLNSKKFRNLTGYKMKKWNKMLIELRNFMIKNKYKLNY